MNKELKVLDANLSRNHLFICGMFLANGENGRGNGGAGRSLHRGQSHGDLSVWATASQRPQAGALLDPG